LILRLQSINLILQTCDAGFEHPANYLNFIVRRFLNLIFVFGFIRKPNPKMWEIFPDRLEKMFSGKREGILVCTHFIAIMSAFTCAQRELKHYYLKNTSYSRLSSETNRSIQSTSVSSTPSCKSTTTICCSAASSSIDQLRKCFITHTSSNCLWLINGFNNKCFSSSSRNSSTKYSISLI